MTWHYITLQYITYYILHITYYITYFITYYITLHYILHYITLHYITCHITLHYITLHYICIYTLYIIYMCVWHYVCVCVLCIYIYHTISTTRSHLRKGREGPPLVVALGRQRCGSRCAGFHVPMRYGARRVLHHRGLEVTTSAPGDGDAIVGWWCF